MKEIRAEVVASVLEVPVKVGDEVKEQDVVVLLESMKMEIPVLAETAGTVDSVNIKPGDTVQAGDVLAVVRPAT